MLQAKAAPPMASAPARMPKVMPVGMPYRLGIIA
jgi:hypothetical protein